MAIIGLQKGSRKRLRVREKSVKSQGILIWIMSGNPAGGVAQVTDRLDMTLLFTGRNKSSQIEEQSNQSTLFAKAYLKIYELYGGFYFMI